MSKVVSYFLVSILIITNGVLLPAKSSENLVNGEDLSYTENTVLKGNASTTDVFKKNTKLKVSINQEINGLENQIGDEFTATILNDVNVNDTNLIPVGSIVVGHIEDIRYAGKASMQGTIEVAFDKIVLPSGKYIPLTGTRFAANRTYTNKNRSLKGDDNGLARGVGIGVVKGATLTFIPGNKAVKTTAIGVAATGAVFSGGWSIGSTATIGALTGLYYGLKKHGKEVKIASGQELEIELNSDQDLTPFEVAIDTVMDQGVQATADSTETVIK
ncbi:MAG: hypothetical protein A3B68_01285 [Candidatus Melainabacteria bacterium RIFCSPHIGHO2_02_FULL_34_12]|nr:MAG: hypothetical protein A3B68_01285 [Candidatus Melainabacteria bacterium RIFCSPHIGHO2_02_FULL_34_12]